MEHAALVFVEPSAPQNFLWFAQFFRDCTHLFSFLIGSRVHRTKTNCFEHGVGAGAELRGVEIFDQTSSPATARDPHPGTMPLSFTSIYSAADRVFENWFSAATDLGPVHQLLLETLPPCELDLESVLLRLVQALEIFYHRKRRPTSTQKSSASIMRLS